jgi:hypothetical protein
MVPECDAPLNGAGRPDTNLAECLGSATEMVRARADAMPNRQTPKR